MSWGLTAIIVSSTEMPELYALGGMLALVIAYFFVREFINHRDIVVRNGMLTARSLPIPTLERYKSFEVQKVGSCRVLAKHYEGTRGVTTYYYVGMSVKGGGKDPQYFLHVKGKGEAGRIAQAIEKALRKTRSNK